MPGTEQIIRPAAVLPEQAAATIVAALSANDVSRGGVWNASVSVWQLYDRPWAGVAGTRGDAQLVGTIAVVYDSPLRHQITIYKAAVTDFGVEIGWSVEGLCDAALQFAGLTLASCPRADLAAPPAADPFHSSTVAAGTLSERIASLAARNR
ncbi:MAG: hypothetical protein QOG49_210 [Frankiaceae bacterium]|nr:hypothetical protein [Frankiaceae bacterium]